MLVNRYGVTMHNVCLNWPLLMFDWAVHNRVLVVRRACPISIDWWDGQMFLADRIPECDYCPNRQQRHNLVRSRPLNQSVLGRGHSSFRSNRNLSPIVHDVQYRILSHNCYRSQWRESFDHHCVQRIEHNAALPVRALQRPVCRNDAQKRPSHQIYIYSSLCCPRRRRDWPDWTDRVLLDRWETVGRTS